MVTVMTNDEVCNLFNCNPCLTLPIIVETGSSVQGELENAGTHFLNSYTAPKPYVPVLNPLSIVGRKLQTHSKAITLGISGKQVRIYSILSKL